jgi:hypothetical protein
MIIFDQKNPVSAYNRHPFTEASSMRSDKGSIPDDVIVDAVLYPPVQGPFYVSKLEATASDLYLELSNDDGLFGMCVINTKGNQYSGSVLYVDGEKNTVRRGDSGRIYALQGQLWAPIGTIVAGPGAENTELFDTIELGEDAMVFSPVVGAGATDLGVYSITARGTNHAETVSGTVKFSGVDGVETSTRSEGGKNILRIDVVGCLPEEEEDPENPGQPRTKVVSGFKLEQAEGASIVPVVVDNIVYLTTPVGLDEICPTDRSDYGELIGAEDYPCSDEAASEESRYSCTGELFEWPDGSAPENETTVAPENADIYFAAPSALGYINPIHIRRGSKSIALSLRGK